MATALAILPGPARAEELPDPGGPTVDVHGFVSQGYLQTSYNDYLTEDSTRGSFEFTEVGINFTSQLSDELRVGVQLFAHDLGDAGNYRPQFDWYYLDYRLRDWLGLRAGRTKIPFGLYNETSDIDAARVPVLLPQSVYPVANRDYLLAQTGGELYGNLRIGGAGELEYRAYGGTIHLDRTDSEEISRAEVPYVYGGRLMWLTPLQGLQLGGAAQALRLDIDVELDPATLAPLAAAGLLPPGFSGTVEAEIRGLLWVASVEYAANDFLIASEYSRWNVELQSNLPVLYPDTQTVSERFYVMTSYRVTPWFTPGVYYSVLFPDVDVRSGRGAYQHDVALSFRYDLTPNWLLKIEGHYMHGTADLERSLNENRELDTLSRDWGILLIKTTAYF